MGNCGAKTKVAEDVPRGLPSELTLKKKAELQTVLDADGIKREVCFEERETCPTLTSAFGVDVSRPMSPSLALGVAAFHFFSSGCWREQGTCGGCV